MGESLLAAQIRRAHAAAIAAGLTIGAGEAFQRELAGEMGRQPTPEELQALLLTWALVARPEQLPPQHDDWDTWMVLAGRGFGKTRTGAQWCKGEIEEGRMRRLALVGATAADTRDVMIEGESGIMSLYAHEPESRRPKYEPSKRRITWPNGAIATAYSAEKPDRLRGPQHDGFWADELAAWSVKLPKKDQNAATFQPGRPPAWDQLQFGLRLGRHPRGIVTTTPRAISIIRELRDDPRCYVSGGSTYDNAPNLATPFLKAVLRAYEGTRLGRQELNAEILDDNPNALWKQQRIDQLRVARAPEEMRRIALAIDPAVTSSPDSDMTGIVAAGIAPCWAFPGCNGDLHAFVLRDESDIYTPAGWAQRACALYKKLECDRIIGEVNNGGDLVEANLRANGDPEVGPNAAYRAVTASRGKQVRAEPIASLYEQGKVHHVGTFAKLEGEMTQWDPVSGMRSPSRMDALVWVLTDLLHHKGAVPYRPHGPVGNRRM